MDGATGVPETPQAPAPADVDAQPLWSLIRAAHRVERLITATLAGFGLTPVQFGVLTQLAAGAPRPPPRWPAPA